MSTRGELLALRKEAEAANFALSASDRRKIPEPEIGAGTKSSTTAGGNLGGIFVLQASLPLFDHGKPERTAAEARARQAQARAQSFERAIAAEIAGLRAGVLERRDTAQRYGTTAVAGADQIERIAQVSYDAGERGILELLDAYRTGSGARLRQATLDLAVRIAEIELEFASGWEIPS
jgi:cobalt-zinc-cadmium efflux system outer membrane protein